MSQDLDPSGAPSDPQDKPTQGKEPGASPPSSVPTAPEDVLNRISRLEARIASLQSGKDKGVNRVESLANELSERLDKYDQYLAKNMTPEQARRELAIDDLLASRGETRENLSPQDNPAGNRQPSAASVDERAILTQLGLDANDEAVIAILNDKKDAVERVAAFSNLAIERKTQAARQPTPGQAMPTGGGTSVPDELAGSTERLENILKNPHLHTQAELNEATQKLERLIKSR